MRLHILSDLHIEFGLFQPDKVEADVIVLAGDIHVGTRGLRWVIEHFRAKPVIYVLGNHEFYGENIPILTSEIKDLAKGSNVHVLENDRLEMDGVVFLGATLWTDFRLYGDVILAEAAAVTTMMDFRKIRFTHQYHRFRPAGARLLHAQSVTWLKKQIEDLRGRKFVVVTHHAPSPRSISERYRNDPLNPAFASNLEPMIQTSGAALWIHGHIHQHADYMVGNTRVIANPRGYPQEGYADFDSLLTIEI